MRRFYSEDVTDLIKSKKVSLSKGVSFVYHFPSGPKVIFLLGSNGPSISILPISLGETFTTSLVFRNVILRTIEWYFPTSWSKISHEPRPCRLIDQLLSTLDNHSLKHLRSALTSFFQLSTFSSGLSFLLLFSLSLIFITSCLLIGKMEYASLI